jgi:hypothetical protein
MWRLLLEWRTELASLACVITLFVFAVMSTHAQSQLLNQQCTGKTCTSSGSCPSAPSSCNSGVSCGSYLSGWNLLTCNSGSNSQYCNVVAPLATCTSLCQCFCVNGGILGGLQCLTTYKSDGNPNSCAAQGNNAYCNNPP